nr:immunoglobulin light chain junction region [Macaca mulatta]MOW03248.1 immunoglobulin light chain junction region [Macaca mulatta]
DYYCAMYHNSAYIF